MEAFQNRLYEYMDRRFSTILPPVPVSPRALTIGVEHEFFLEKDGAPSNHLQSQAFFYQLGHITGWTLKVEGDTILGRMITSAVYVEAGRATKVKYEHHPHLLEIAFDFRENLHALHALVEKVWKAVEEATDQAGLDVFHRPMACCPPEDDRIISPLPFYMALREYRTQLLRKSGRKLEVRLLNFSATIAATQIQIGGINWWEDSQIIGELYRIEPQVLPLSLRNVEHAESASETLRSRWAGYIGILEDCPLVGYPDLHDWTKKAWADALAKSPALGNTQLASDQSTADVVAQHSCVEMDTFFNDVRDLQIIKPRTFGTIEFRADPCQKSGASVLAMAAIRLGCCIGAVMGNKTSRTFREAREHWWRDVHDFRPNDSTDLVKYVSECLKLRGLGEEKYLDATIVD